MMKKNVMVGNYMLDTLLGKIKKVTGTGKFDNAKI